MFFHPKPSAISHNLLTESWNFLFFRCCKFSALISTNYFLYFIDPKFRLDSKRIVDTFLVEKKCCWSKHPLFMNISAIWDQGKALLTLPQWVEINFEEEFLLSLQIHAFIFFIISSQTLRVS